MIVKLESGTTYDLSLTADCNKLNNNIATMKSRKQYDRLKFLYQQVAQYNTYQGSEEPLASAKKIALKIAAILNNITAVSPNAQPHLPNSVQIAPNHPANPTPTEPNHQLTQASQDNSQDVQRATLNVISMAPLNSSGDIYHILAFLILLQSIGTPLPDVQLNYDVEPSTEGKKPNHSDLSVGDQVKRSSDFAATLGFFDRFKIQRIEYAAGHTTVRQICFNDFFMKSSQNADYNVLDQMATTTLISSQILKQGYDETSKILFKGFQNRDQNHFPVVAQQVIDRFVTSSIKKIEEQRTSATQPLIVLHIRQSSKANKELNLSGIFVINLARFLLEKKYQVCFVLADDRKKNESFSTNTAFDDSNRPIVLEPFKSEDFFINNQDYAKQAHLQLLLGLKQNSTTKGVIGNTSGTLDIAALIGLSTYCIHQFSNSALSYQECRLYFQLAFLSIGAIKKVIKDNKALDTWDEELQDWLDKPQQGKGLRLFNPTAEPKALVDDITEKKAQYGYSKMFYYSFFQKGTSKQVPLTEPSDVINQLAKRN